MALDPHWPEITGVNAWSLQKTWQWVGMESSMEENVTGFFGNTFAYFLRWHLLFKNIDSADKNNINQPFSHEADPIWCHVTFTNRFTNRLLRGFWSKASAA